MSVQYKCVACETVFYGFPCDPRKYCSLECYKNNPPTKHGGSRTRLYYVWQSMWQRCKNKKHHAYRHYGGRGINVCAEWESFPRFQSWALDNGYSAGLEIDRRNNNAGYSPDNCQWSTNSQNSANTRKKKNCSSVFKGVSKHGKKWRAVIKKGDTKKHIGYFSSQLAAALAFDDAAHEIHGGHAMLNFPERKAVSV